MDMANNTPKQGLPTAQLDDSDPLARELCQRINRRFARHVNDEVMLSLKTVSRRILLARLKESR